MLFVLFEWFLCPLSQAASALNELVSARWLVPIPARLFVASTSSAGHLSSL